MQCCASNSLPCAHGAKSLSRGVTLALICSQAVFRNLSVTAGQDRLEWPLRHLLQCKTSCGDASESSLSPTSGPFVKSSLAAPTSLRATGGGGCCQPQAGRWTARLPGSSQQYGRRELLIVVPSEGAVAALLLASLHPPDASDVGQFLGWTWQTQRPSVTSAAPPVGGSGSEVGASIANRGRETPHSARDSLRSCR